jgi:hypothetical protein
MIVKIEGAEPGYKGLKEFTTGQRIIDISLPTDSLPDDIKLKGFSVDRHRFPGGLSLFIAAMTLEIGERNLIMTGSPRTKNADAEPQVIFGSHFQGKSIPAVLRHENMPYNGTIIFPKNTVSTESVDVRFVKQFKWPV